MRDYDLRLFAVGAKEIHISDVLMVLVSISALFVFADWLRGWIVRRALARTHLDTGTRQAIGSITRYVVLVAGFMIIMQTIGINLSTFNVLAGAIGVGVGFGLQDIVKNFISGLIIMFDRPIHIGDRIEIKGVTGEVQDIGARRITMTTPEGITIVVPNAMLITETVTNLQGPSGGAPVRVAVNVSRDSDLRLAQKLLYEVAAANPHVQKEPPPFVSLKTPTAAVFPFEMQVWTARRDRDREEVLNELNYGLHEKFSAAGVKLA